MELNEGIEFNLTHIVSEADTAIAHKSGGLEVLATPAMIALMEQAAYNLLKEKGVESVGTSIKINHTRASLCDTQLSVKAVVTSVEGRKIGFKVEAADNKGSLGEGEHTRFIIDPERFISKLK